ncbi:peptide/nickel transport system permease protein [Paenibacillus phyllosphaerae]|uniref:Peptide/nickel transport system permease protein n=1 Tax=Paenibacillus phyllosphaerae TaxID=274593 RepID=A0A7W5B400_9BACL|nr:peptide/nickel transport system permease protein [Paenibacillus phyllosphaerae]
MVEYVTAPSRRGIAQPLTAVFRKMLRHPVYRYLLFLSGAPITLIVLVCYQYRRSKLGYRTIAAEVENELRQSGDYESLAAEVRQQQQRKHRFFGRQPDEKQLEREVAHLASLKFNARVKERIERNIAERGRKITFEDTYRQLIESPLLFLLSLLLGWPMYILMGIYANPYLKYIAERLVMAIFVIFGVAFLVFTLLYLSPMNPAANLLGETATDEQIASFNRLYGLDQPYLVQLWDSLKGILTFDLGKSFAGNEQVTEAIAGKFPVTLTLTVVSTLIAVLIALPIGIISATRPNSFFDYTFMFIALLGLSIPNFWQGLIFILNFSIKQSWLPATYNPENWLSAVMPIVVLGTGLTAAVARMTRSSTLEVIHEDYITTAKAKGLSRRTVLWRHAVGNALIPIVTVIGLQFGGMLGGAAVTEKVFNISGIGSYIVDKQIIPDIPSIMGGVVYTAITISVVNVLVDLLYAFLDPRIRSKMKQY